MKILLYIIIAYLSLKSQEYFPTCTQNQLKTRPIFTKFDFQNYYNHFQ